MILNPHETGHKLDKQDNEGIWNVEQQYGEMFQLANKRLLMKQLLSLTAML